MKKLLAFLTAILLLAGCAAEQGLPSGTDTEPSAAQSAMTKERWTDTDGTALDYWLYTPENPAEDMPLIVYLHGGSGKGNDLEKILDEGSLPGYLWSGQLSPVAYVLIPQLPESCKGWTDRAEALMKLVSHVEADCAIDSDRVSLTGHSMGGTGAWAIIPRPSRRWHPSAAACRSRNRTCGSWKICRSGRWWAKQTPSFHRTAAKR